MAGVEIDMAPIRIRNAALVPKMLGAIHVLFQFESRNVEAYMRQNAPWSDQTGNARNGLTARPYNEGLHVGIDLFHTVPYGIWLEVKSSGKYAIIVPTVSAMGPKVIDSVRGLLGKM